MFILAVFGNFHILPNSIDCVSLLVKIKSPCLFMSLYDVFAYIEFQHRIFGFTIAI